MSGSRAHSFISALALVLVLCALSVTDAYAQLRSSEPLRRMPAAELLQELRKGGYILYFRHTATDFSKNDEAMTSFEDCASQRNLTEARSNETLVVSTRALAHSS